jgi:hypothetical protein
MLSICSARSYFAAVMILWHDPALREKHTRTWDGLTAAWKATFHQDLSSRALEKWPEDGPHGFNAAESAWLAATLRFLKHGRGRPTSTRRRVVPAAAAAAAATPPPPAEPPRRDSSKAQHRQGASPKTCDPDPVRSASRFANCILIIYTFYAIYTIYNNHYDNSLSLYHLLTLYTLFMLCTLFSIYYLYTL